MRRIILHHGVFTKTSCSVCLCTRSFPWRQWWEPAVSLIFTLTARVRKKLKLAYMGFNFYECCWCKCVAHTLFSSHVWECVKIYIKQDKVDRWGFTLNLDKLSIAQSFSITAVSSLTHSTFFLQDGRRVWKSRTCTSVITAWTSRPTCSTRSIVTATQSAPSHMPSTTSPSGSHLKETSRWEWCVAPLGWGLLLFYKRWKMF